MAPTDEFGGGSWLTHFADLNDPPIERTQKHKRIDIIAIAPHSYVHRLDKNHGRVERRRCWAISDPEFLRYLRHKAAWAKLQTVFRMERERYLPNQPVSREYAYFMTSLPNEATH
jgi:hypothetical protein